MSGIGDVLNQARGWLGTVEEPGGSNHCAITERFADLSGWDWARSGNPWCDMTVSVVLTDAGIPTTYAYCPSHVNAFKAAGTWHSFDDAQAGDVVFFDWDGDGVADHVGFIEAVNGDRAYTIEGNSGGPNGDGVYRQSRHRSLILGLGTPAYSDTSVSLAGGPVEITGSATAELAAGSHPVLRQGSTGNEVSVWQTLVGGITVDGSFGPKTKAATIGFQQRAKIETDGIVGPVTWDTMGKVLAYLIAVGGNQAFPGETRQGSSGAAVTQLQQRLSDLGYGVDVDGQFGPQTAAAVRQFQTDRGITVDGIVGPQTWQALW